MENHWKGYLTELKYCQREFSNETVHDLRAATMDDDLEPLLMQAVDDAYLTTKQHVDLFMQTLADFFWKTYLHRISKRSIVIMTAITLKLALHTQKKWGAPVFFGIPHLLNLSPGVSPGQHDLPK